MKYLFLSFVFFAVGCVTAPPIQEMSDARQAISVAEQELDNLSVTNRANLATARRFLEEAEIHLREGRYDLAKSLAITAKDAASDILEMAKSIPNRDYPIKQ